MSISLSPHQRARQGWLRSFATTASASRAHLGQEILRLAGRGAGEGEILPDHDAVLVAQVEERVVLVDVAAPAADHVAAEVVEQRRAPAPTRSASRLWKASSGTQLVPLTMIGSPLT